MTIQEAVNNTRGRFFTLSFENSYGSGTICAKNPSVTSKQVTVQDVNTGRTRRFSHNSVKGINCGKLSARF